MEKKITNTENGVRFALGTAQFGSPYGISNEGGKPSVAQVKVILSRAAERRVELIDTAASYGNTETRLGELLPHNHEFKIVTKLSLDQRMTSQSEIVQSFQASFHQSLHRLKQTAIHALMFHNPSDLTGRYGSSLFRAAEALKAEKRVSEIGVSVYSPVELLEIVDRFPIDVAQVPLNLLDQRVLRNGCLERMKEMSIQIHARSIFLQGLLLLAVDDLPTYFRPYRAVLKRFKAAAKAAHTSPLAAAVSFIKNVPNVDYAVIGICDTEQFEETGDVFSRPDSAAIDYSEMASDDLGLIDPTRWRVDR